MHKGLPFDIVLVIQAKGMSLNNVGMVQEQRDTTLGITELVASK